MEDLAQSELLTTAHVEFLYNTLTPLFDTAVDKWKRCTWSHPVGLLGLIDLKQLSSMDAQQQYDLALPQIRELLRKLDQNYVYDDVLALARNAEWERYGQQAIDYLKNVEAIANTCAECAKTMLEQMKDGAFQPALASASALLTLEESVRGDRKFVWRELAQRTVLICDDVLHGWMPRYVIDHLGEKEVVGMVESWATLYTLKEYYSCTHGHEPHPKWTATESGLLLYNRPAIGAEIVETL
jgi:hypothetical protein